MAEYKYKIIDGGNLNKGTARGLDMVRDSLHKLGAGRSILVDLSFPTNPPGLTW